MNQVWVAFQYDANKRCWEPSRIYNKVYRQIGHVKAAVQIKKGLRWVFVREDPNRIEYHLVHYYRNPISRQIEAHPSPDTKLIFINVAGLVTNQLPVEIAATILQLPTANHAAASND
jgi:hypothetical protein